MCVLSDNGAFACFLFCAASVVPPRTGCDSEATRWGAEDEPLIGLSFYSYLLCAYMRSRRLCSFHKMFIEISRLTLFLTGGCSVPWSALSLSCGETIFPCRSTHYLTQVIITPKVPPASQRGCRRLYNSGIHEQQRCYRTEREENHHPSCWIAYSHGCRWDALQP